MKRSLPPWRLLLLSLFLLAAGCSRKGALSGRVTVNGAPLPAGVISFHSEAGNREVHNAPIRQGEYSLEGAPTGQARVTVTAQGAGTSGDANRGGAFQGGNPGWVPPRYADPAQSGLNLIIRRGKQTYEVDLTP